MFGVRSATAARCWPAHLTEQNRRPSLFQAWNGVRQCSHSCETIDLTDLGTRPLCQSRGSRNRTCPMSDPPDRQPTLSPYLEMWRCACGELNPAFPCIRRMKRFIRAPARPRAPRAV